MGVTHKKRLFAKHFAKHADRKGAVIAAGYAENDWARTATRLLAEPEVLELIEGHQERALQKFDSADITDAFVLGEMCDLLERIKACGMGAWQASAETRILEALGRYRQLFSERIAPTPPAGPINISVGFIEAHHDPLPALPAAPAIIEGGEGGVQASTNDAQNAPPTPSMGIAESEGKVKQPAPCPRHGAQTLREVRLSNSNTRIMVPHCESCSREAQEAENKLNSLTLGRARWPN